MEQNFKLMGRKKCIGLTIAICSSFFCSFNSLAAEIIVGNTDSPPALILKGEIVKGDAQRLFELSVANPKAMLLYLESEGGDVQEAMKIGSLVGELYLMPFIGEKCYSACTFIALAAPRRVFAGSFGLHRPYFAKSYFSSLTPSEAERRYTAMESETREFLSLHFVPTEVIDKIFKISSEDMWLLDATQAERIFGRYKPHFHEWLIAQCGPEAEWQKCPVDRQYEVHEQALYNMSTEVAADLRNGYRWVIRDLQVQEVVAALESGRQLDLSEFKSKYPEYRNSSDQQVLTILYERLGRGVVEYDAFVRRLVGDAHDSVN